MTHSKWFWLVVAALPVIAANLVGNAVTMPNIPTWYAGLVKPSFTPPNWLFAPVWTTLYALMIWAFWRILRSPDGHPGRRAAIAVFIVHMAVNALWSVTFFGLRQIGAGLAVSVLLETMVVATMFAFNRVDGMAAIAVAPTALWVAYATALNAAIWHLNG